MTRRTSIMSRLDLGGGSAWGGMSGMMSIDIATLVWAMDIEYVGKRPIDLDGYVDEGIVIRPPTLQVKFSPRSHDVAEIIERTLEEFGYKK
ncbi:hypothetical protein NLJ89_g3686 [Agrocybe chaxingu]|uniref:Uncharacterized protein n=1 Tax=Agrocybe chaxingu TaxID=84603 RepID=A0A9W8K4S8_9AGAR|nr:hypothetical protein NLJ89_g3686 [Agrocybe chaxingu]